MKKKNFEYAWLARNFISSFDLSFQYPWPFEHCKDPRDWIGLGKLTKVSIKFINRISGASVQRSVQLDNQVQCV